MADVDEYGEVGIPQQKPTIQAVVEELLRQSEGVPTATILYGLSELTPAEAAELAGVWPGLDEGYRYKVLQMLVDVGENNFELDYEAIGMLTLDDSSPRVRAAAIETLWMVESTELMERLLKMAVWDEDGSVRAEAVGSLGRYILLGEYEELPDEAYQRVLDCVIERLQDANEVLLVRRRALEALANSSHKGVPDTIREAYASPEDEMRISAVYAMGRTYDKRWKDIVLQELDSRSPEMVYEAARSSGELEIEEAVPHLHYLTRSDDRELAAVAIWALGEIGGDEAVRILDALYAEAEEAEDYDLIEAIDDAIGSATLAGRNLFMLDIDMDESFDLDDDDF